MESRPTQAVLPLVGLAAEKVIRDRYKTGCLSPSATAAKLAFRRLSVAAKSRSPTRGRWGLNRSVPPGKSADTHRPIARTKVDRSAAAWPTSAWTSTLGNS
ncbi:MAG: hypothetical protein ACQESR_28500 [Planctomycetota bacterium]